MRANEHQFYSLSIQFVVVASITLSSVTWKCWVLFWEMSWYKTNEMYQLWNPTIKRIKVKKDVIFSKCISLWRRLSQASKKIVYFSFSGPEFPWWYKFWSIRASRRLCGNLSFPRSIFEQKHIPISFAWGKVIFRSHPLIFIIPLMK